MRSQLSRMMYHPKRMSELEETRWEREEDKEDLFNQKGGRRREGRERGRGRRARLITIEASRIFLQESKTFLTGKRKKVERVSLIVTISSQMDPFLEQLRTDERRCVQESQIKRLVLDMSLMTRYAAGNWKDFFFGKREREREALLLTSLARSERQFIFPFSLQQNIIQ